MNAKQLAVIALTRDAQSAVTEVAAVLKAQAGVRFCRTVLYTS